VIVVMVMVVVVVVVVAVVAGMVPGIALAPGRPVAAM
jgi:hypothetical protein